VGLTRPSAAFPVVMIGACPDARDATPGETRTVSRMRHSGLQGKGTLALIIVGGGVVYLAIVLGFTIAQGDSVPLLGWIGFAIVTAVVLVASGVLSLFLLRSSTGAGARRPSPPPEPPPGTHRVLVVVDEGCPADALCRSLTERSGGRPTEALVVAPALVSPVHYLDSDVDAAGEAARARLSETLGVFAAAGIPARGEVGSESPLEAIADELATFPADEIVIATPPAEQSNWLERGVVTKAHELYEQPVTHLVVQPRAQSGVPGR
jgi:hypothetical protein